MLALARQARKRTHGVRSFGWDSDGAKGGKRVHFTLSYVALPCEIVCFRAVRVRERMCEDNTGLGRR